MRDVDRAVVPWLSAIALVASAAIAWPFLPWILIALWSGVLLRPPHAWLAAHLGHRPRLAAIAITVGLLAVLTPVVLVATSLAGDALALVERTLATDRLQSALRTLSGHDGASTQSPDLLELAVTQGGRAWEIAQRVAGTAAQAAIGFVILVAGVYELLVDGARWYAWIEDHAPLSRATFRRLGGAVIETGRGLVFGIVGAGLVQAIVATICFVALGVPQPYALGLLTLACSVVPTLGTALVWVPVAIGLEIAGRDGAAIALVIAGVVVIGNVDNFVRPYLARRGSLRLPAVAVALGMFGGVAALGARGLLVGPLVLRVGKELLAIWREQRADDDDHSR